MKAPAISVLLPFRDAATTLARCLDSISAQTFHDYEVLAIDDGSQDGSAQLVAQRAHSDPRIRLVRAEGDGLVAALNQGLTACRAALVARMDADDAMHAGRLAAQHAHMSSAPDLAVSATQVVATSDGALSEGFAAYIDWQNACLSARDIADEIFVESPFAHPSVCLRREVVIAAGAYRDGPFPEDYELWLRLAEAGARMEKLPRKLLYWHDHPERLSRRDPRCSRDAFDAVRARYLLRDPRVAAGRERLCVWGAGRRTRQRIRRLLEAGLRPRAWVDVDPRKIGNRIDGVPVISPEGLAALPAPFVLACVASHGARPRISRALDAMGLVRGRDYLHVG